jgi:hypothetical protein
VVMDLTMESSDEYDDGSATHGCMAMDMPRMDVWLLSYHAGEGARGSRATTQAERCMATPEGRRMAIQLPCRRRRAWLLSYQAGGKVHGYAGGKAQGYSATVQEEERLATELPGRREGAWLRRGEGAWLFSYRAGGGALGY